jgi:hypothetical protein
MMVDSGAMNTKKIVVLSSLLSSALTLLAVFVLAQASVASRTLLENARVRVLEVTYPPGAARDRSIRRTDQVIVFLDDCRYERTDSSTGEKTVRERKSGDVIWHSRGEDAPVLKNLTSHSYRTLTIEIR